MRWGGGARLTCYLIRREGMEGETDMAQVTKLGRVLFPVADQDAAIAFYTQALGFTLTADVPFGQDDRWVEVTPPGGGAAVALVPPRGRLPAGTADRDLDRPDSSVVTLLFDGSRLQADVTAEVPVADYTQGQGPDPAGWPGWTWESSTHTPLPGRAGSRCWCPGGQSGRNADSTERPQTRACRPRRARGQGRRRRRGRRYMRRQRHATHGIRGGCVRPARAAKEIDGRPARRYSAVGDLFFFRDHDKNTLMIAQD